MIPKKELIRRQNYNTVEEFQELIEQVEKLRDFCQEYLPAPMELMEAMDFEFPEYISVGACSFEKNVKLDLLVLVMSPRISVHSIGIHFMRSSEEDVKELLKVLKDLAKDAIQMHYRTNISQRHSVRGGDRYNTHH